MRDFGGTWIRFLDKIIFVRLYLSCARVLDHWGHLPLKTRGLKTQNKKNNFH
jgi:hypothetical protein